MPIIPTNPSIFIDATIAEQQHAVYLSSIPYIVAFETKGLAALTTNEKQGYAYTQFLLNRTWTTWSATQQNEFWALIDKLKIPIPLPKPRDLGKDFLGRDIGSYTPQEYKLWKEREDKLALLRLQSRAFREKESRIWEGERAEKSHLEGEGYLTDESETLTEEEIQTERARRREIAQLRGKGSTALKIFNGMDGCL